ncbi:MAG TPA: 4-alpha-glucanotransferase [Polyangiaceae bacterium]|nr:4-alpha-glucanotransferase [Polyangiaceae bacterium]
MNPLHERRSGILLHPTSLPGAHGHGDLGPEAHEFLRFLARAGQSLWQMLPVVPPGGGDSPYDSPSSFAGSAELVSLRYLVEDGLLDAGQLAAPARLRDCKRARYGTAKRFRAKRLRQAFQRFQSGVSRHGLEELRERERFWLPDYTLYAALKGQQHGRAWFHWPADLRRREPSAVAAARAQLETEISYHEFVQLMFDRQWQRLRGHARHLGVLLLGDIPMFVAHDGADVWQNQHLFLLDEQGERRGVAGVPPDYFSADGQRWGNPLYDWSRLRETGYAWWIERLRSNLRRFDAIRLDHFIGFHRYWEIPTHSPSAREGHFVEVPGHDFFSRAREALGDLPFIAEDLGIVTPEVERLRDAFELPGMRVLAFAFADGAQAYLPHRFNQRCVVYTGTHDNDTMLGFLDAADRAQTSHERDQLLRQRDRALAYAGSDGREPHWDLMRSALASVANTAIFPIQDVLGLGAEARMNVPGTPDGNWGYRLDPGLLSSNVAAKLARLTETYERLPSSLRRDP